jgi:seryl-tRNA synthetase
MVARYGKQYKEALSKGSYAVTTHTDFSILHLDSKKKVIDSYDAERKIGKNSSMIYYRNRLINRIDKILNEQNQTMYYIIETRMTNRKLEAQHNETLRHKIEIEDLKRKQEEAMKRSEEAQRQLLKNVEKLNRQNEKIQNLTDTINQQRDQIKTEREAQRVRVKALTKKFEDIEEKLKDQEIKHSNRRSETVKIKRRGKNTQITAHLSDNPEKVYFKQGNCYLCARDSLIDSEKRRTKCCDSESLNTVWLIRKSAARNISWNGNTYNVEGSYTIFNEEYGRYLYDSLEPYDESLLIRQDRQVVPLLGHWKITRLSDDGFHIQSPRGKYISECFTRNANYTIRWEIIPE